MQLKIINNFIFLISIFFIKDTGYIPTRLDSEDLFLEPVVNLFKYLRAVGDLSLNSYFSCRFQSFDNVFHNFKPDVKPTRH